MLLDWWKTMLLLPLLIQAQSGGGGGDMDMKPRVSCTSHISNGEGSSLTCKLVNSRYHIDDDEDEDEESDVIEKMTACCCSSLTTNTCVEEFGATVGSKHLIPAGVFNLTVHLKKGGEIEVINIDPKKIVKPKSPWVQNVAFNKESDLAVVHIQIPYRHDYLTLENQLFQLQIWGAGRNTTLNFTSTDTMNIPLQHLQKNKQYHVKVRAMPQLYLQGTWSEWSKTYSFITPPEVRKPPDGESEIKKICLVFVVLVVVVTLSVTVLWKIKILTYMWPSVPHPKHTLVQICKPNKGLLLTFNPEVFSALKVYPVDQTEEQSSEETQPVIPPAADDVQVTDPCSTQSSDCSRSNISISTEELELLSRNSSEGEESLHSTSPSPVDTVQFREAPNTSPPEHTNQEHEPEMFGVAQPDEAYVTMSSFYQIK